MRHFGLDFKDKHKDEIREFLIKAKQYGYGKATPIIKQDGANEITYKLGDWLYTDTWYGGEPFSGITTIAYRGKVCWAMHYHGFIKADERANNYRKRKTIECLVGALTTPESEWGPNENPVRGRPYESDGFIYDVYFEYGPNDISRFRGKEHVHLAPTSPDPPHVFSHPYVIYLAEFFGGFVNLY